MLATIPASRGSVCHTLTLQCPMGDWCVNVCRRLAVNGGASPFAANQECPHLVVGPDPGEDVGQQCAAMRVGMPAVTPVVPHLVPRAERSVLIGLGVRILER